MNAVSAGTVDRLNVADIVAEARRLTGLRHIGEPDPLPGLDALLEALRTEGRLRPSGIEAQRANFLRVLTNRLRIEDLLRKHPEILREEIRGPIVITGLPRSGTTKLLRLIAADPGVQKLPLWKILNPAPIAPPEPDRPDPRIAIAEQLSTTMREHFPDFFAGHPMKADEPDEEEWLLDFVMRGYIQCHTADIPSFARWMDRQDFAGWYGYLRKILQLLQWQDDSPDKPWVIKAPSHLKRLHDLFASFPDATIVHCHRDPVTCIVSISALAEASRRMYSDVEDPERCGRYMLEHWTEQLRGYVEQRAALEARHRFVDVAYREITDDCHAVVERIYRAAGFALTPEARTAMQAWESENPQGRHGTHRYSIDRYGYTAEDVRKSCASYLTRFGALL